MDQLIEQILIEQNPHWEGEVYAQSLERGHNKTAIADLRLDEIQIITGIRRCGKSTLLQALINHLIRQHAAKSILYINFDDPNYAEVCENASNIYTIITTAEKLTTHTIEYLFLDEVQNVESWEKYVKSAYDNRRFKKIFVTGSNADLLTSNYAKLLSGRYIETHVYPLSFQELLINNGITNQLQLVRQKAQVLVLLDTMLNFGGFPRIYHLDDPASRRRILKSYYETILLKDCISNHDVRDVKSFINLTHYVVSQNSNLYSYNSLSRALGINEETTQNFIQILQNSYLIDELRNYSYSLKVQSRSKKKTYCIDNGLITATTFKFSNNYGKLLENLVYAELKKQYGKDIYFYQDDIGCDFIVHGENPFVIQVCYQLDLENRNREVKGLMAAMEKFSIIDGFIITYNQEEVINDNIKIVPFWKWSFALSRN